jgi:5-carboxymethyl-2-hydroxymuconate isomerase
MPHFTVEYSANLAPEIRAPELLLALRDAAMATGEFELAAMRLRAEPREVYLLADGHPENAFVHICAPAASRPPRSGSARRCWPPPARISMRCSLRGRSLC